MKITKRQLRRIIKEEKARLLSESRHGTGLGIGFSNFRSNSRPDFTRAFGKGAYVAGLEYDEATVNEAPSRVVREAALLVDMSTILGDIEGVAKELYGLVDPQDPDVDFGDMLGRNLEELIEKAYDLHGQMEAHFEAMDPVREAMSDEEILAVADKHLAGLPPADPRAMYDLGFDDAKKGLNPRQSEDEDYMLGLKDATDPHSSREANPHDGGMYGESVLREGADTDVYEGDHAPIRIALPALKALATEENFDGEKVWFGDSEAFGIADVLEEDEPRIEDYDYDDVKHEEALEKWNKVHGVLDGWDFEDKQELAVNIKRQIEESEDSGYGY